MRVNSYICAMIADLHASNKLPYARPIENGMTDRLEQQIKLLHAFSQSATEYKAQAIYVLGDLFDKSLIDAVTLTHTMQEVVSWKLPTHILPGNHDAATIKGGRFTVEAFGVIGHDHLHVMGDSKPLAPTEWLRIWAIPYMPVAATREHIAAIRAKLDKSKKNVLMIHNSVLGATHLGWTCDEGLLAEDVCGGGFDWTFAGHFHDTQRFGKKETGLYLGAPMHHHFGDVGRKAGYWMVEFKEDGACKSKFIPTSIPRFHQFDELKKVDKAEGVSKGDYIRYIIEATHADWSKLKLKAQELCEDLKKSGIQASYQQKPIYHHKARMASGKSAAITLEEAVSKYVDMAGTTTGSLSVDKLKRLGQEALAAVRSTYGAA
jgi:DNA repair exonuclease SbcCD nuclease subunit